MDNASNYKAFEDIIQDRHPHILWSSCMAYTPSLLMKDLAQSSHLGLSFLSDCYEKAKGVLDDIKNHTFVLHIFRTFSVLDVIQVNKTRFAHHYAVFEHLF